MNAPLHSCGTMRLNSATSTFVRYLRVDLSKLERDIACLVIISRPGGAARDYPNSIKEFEKPYQPIDEFSKVGFFDFSLNYVGHKSPILFYTDSTRFEFIVCFSY